MIGTVRHIDEVSPRIKRGTKKQKKAPHQTTVIPAGTELYYCTFGYLTRGKDEFDVFPTDDLNWFYKFPADAIVRTTEYGAEKRCRTIPKEEAEERNCLFEYITERVIPNVLVERESRGLSDVRNIKTLKKSEEFKDILKEVQELMALGYNGWMMGEDIMIFKPKQWLARTLNYVSPYEKLKLTMRSLMTYLAVDECVYFNEQANECIPDTRVDKKTPAEHTNKLAINKGLIGPVVFVSNVAVLKWLMADNKVRSDNDQKLASILYKKHRSIGLYMAFRDQGTLILGCDINHVISTSIKAT